MTPSVTLSAAAPLSTVMASATLLFTVLLQSCCGPATCRQTQSGTAALNKAIAEIEKYKERNTRYPVQLDDVHKGFEAETRRDFKQSCPDCADFTYKTDSFGYEFEYEYNQMGKVRCVYSTDSQGWDCKGVY